MIQLENFPLIAQTKGNDANAPNDCGEACLAMTFQWFFDNAPSITDIRQQLGGRMGATSTLQIIAWLKQNSIAAEGHQPKNQRQLLARVWQNLDLQQPTLVLQRYSPSVDQLHWRIVIGGDAKTHTLADPWTGTAVTQAVDELSALFFAVPTNLRSIILTGYQGS